MKNIITVDLGNGDSGKGTITDFLVSKHDSEWTVRFSGGGQAAHNVYVDDHHHTFSQFSSGSYNPNNKTYLSDDMLVNPVSMINEAQVGFENGLRGLLRRVYVNEGAKVTTPYHVEANRLFLKDSGVKNSCGAGIWETVRLPESATMRVKDIANGTAITKLKAIYNYYKDCFGYWEADVDGITPENIVVQFNAWYDAINVVSTDGAIKLLSGSQTPIIYENAQGVLLDDVHGIGDMKYLTPTKVTAVNALKIIDSLTTDTKIEVLGITRTYATRHGEGPLVGESSDMEEFIADDDNTHFEYQGILRTAPLDLTTLAYSWGVIMDEFAGRELDYGLAVTHVDKLVLERGPDFCKFPSDISKFLGAPIKVESFGKKRKHKVLI